MANNHQKLECVKESLNKLASGARSANGIANKLRKLGIKGKKHRPTLCPVAQYLERECGFKVSVNENSIGPLRGFVVYPQEYYYYGNSGFSIHISNFIYNFDNGSYEDLEIK